jgi:hypothetical protein
VRGFGVFGGGFLGAVHQRANPVRVPESENAHASHQQNARIPAEAHQKGKQSTQNSTHIK